MSKVVVFLLLAIPPLLYGCGGGFPVGPECGPGNRYESTYRLTIRNNTAAELSLYSTGRYFDTEGIDQKIKGFDYFSPRKVHAGKEHSGDYVFLDYCDDTGKPPNKEMTYSVRLFKLEKNSVEKNFLALYGTKEDYEENFPEKIKESIPSDTTILEPDGLLFTPGKQRIKDLQLVPLVPEHSKGTEIYTYLDAQRCPYRGERCYSNSTCSFELTLTITDSGDTYNFAWDHTGDYAYGTKTDKNGICIAPTDVSSHTSNSNPANPPGQGKATNPATLLLPQSGSSVRHDTGQLQQSK